MTTQIKFTKKIKLAGVFVLIMVFSAIFTFVYLAIGLNSSFTNFTKRLHYVLFYLPTILIVMTIIGLAKLDGFEQFRQEIKTLPKNIFLLFKNRLN